MENIDDLNRFKEMLRNSQKEQLIEIIVNKAERDTKQKESGYGKKISCGIC